MVIFQVVGGFILLHNSRLQTGGPTKFRHANRTLAFHFAGYVVPLLQINSLLLMNAVNEICKQERFTPNSLAASLLGGLIRKPRCVAVGPESWPYAHAALILVFFLFDLMYKIVRLQGEAAQGDAIVASTTSP